MLDVEQKKEILETIGTEEGLSFIQAKNAFEVLFTEPMDQEFAKDFLLSLSKHGETPYEIEALMRLLQSKMVHVSPLPKAMDVCGTGGDGIGTLNISTATAFVVAAAGIPMAKHGGRSVSSKSGSADVLQEMGIQIDAPHEKMSAAFHEVGIGFFWAPQYHPAMAMVAPLRAELKVRTIFNLVGPLLNPADVTYQLVGVYEKKLCAIIAEVLRRKGLRRALVVHGVNDGVDEVSISGLTMGTLMDRGANTVWGIHPDQVGLPVHPLEAIKGGDAKENATAMIALFNGQQGAYTDAVIINAAVALWVAEKVADVTAGVALAKSLLREGLVRQKFDALKGFLA